MTKDEALKLALEAFNNLAAWNDGEVGSHMDEPHSAKVAREAITAIKAALEAKDEPWEKFCDSNCVWTDHHPDCKLAQRTWVGLTDEERGQVYVDWRFNGSNSSNLELCKVIEAKLKEKIMTDWTKEEDEAFNMVEKNSNLGKQILRANKSSGMDCCTYDCTQGRNCPVRNKTLDEVAHEFSLMKSLGDTAQSFAAYVRGMKK